MWTIKDASPTDYPRIYEMSDAIQQHELDMVGYPVLPPEKTTDAYIKAIIDTATHKGGEILVCEMAGETVAYLIGYSKTDSDELAHEDFRYHAHIADLFVEPDARKQGIARALIQTFADRMKTKGCNWLRVWAKSKNKYAIETYLKSGFDSYETIFVKKL